MAVTIKPSRKTYSSLYWDLPSIILFTNELLSRVFFPHWWSLSSQSEHLSTFFPLSSYELKGAHSLPGFIWWQHSHKKINLFFFPRMTSNLSRGISDLHNFFFFKAFPCSNTDICRVYYFWRSYLAKLSRLHQFEKAWFFFLHIETQEKICLTVAISKRLNQL